MRLFFFFSFFPSPGALPVPLQLRPEGSAEKPAAGGPDQAFREPQEWSQRYQEPQVVRHHRLDRHLPEEGKSPATNTPATGNRCVPSHTKRVSERWRLARRLHRFTPGLQCHATTPVVLRVFKENNSATKLFCPSHQCLKYRCE